MKETSRKTFEHIFLFNKLQIIFLFHPFPYPQQQQRMAIFQAKDNFLENIFKKHHDCMDTISAKNRVFTNKPDGTKVNHIFSVLLESWIFNIINIIFHLLTTLNASLISFLPLAS